MTLEEKLQNLPDSPGVYMMKDARGHVIYIGKAVSLWNRVRSYFQKGPKGEKTEIMVRQIADLETIVTHTELEALALESNLIKKHHPRYNIILRDDKNYPYLRFDLKSEYPRLEVVRRLKKDGALYYGPYVPAGGMWETLALIRRTFPIAPCKIEFKTDRPGRPCIQFQIGRCIGPCSGEADKNQYQDMVGQVRLFLEGKNRDLLDMLKQHMEEASERMEYERAAELRDRIGKIEGALEKQKIISSGFENQDVIGMASEAGRADIQALFIRNGMLLGRKDFYLDDVRGMTEEEVLSDFLRQFYCKRNDRAAGGPPARRGPRTAKPSKAGSRKSGAPGSRCRCPSGAASASWSRWPRTMRPSRFGSISCPARARSGSSRGCRRNWASRTFRKGSRPSIFRPSRGPNPSRAWSPSRTTCRTRGTTRSSRSGPSRARTTSRAWPR